LAFWIPKVTKDINGPLNHSEWPITHPKNLEKDVINGIILNFYDLEEPQISKSWVATCHLCAYKIKIVVLEISIITLKETVEMLILTVNEKTL